MGWFSSKEKSFDGWRTLDSLEQLDALLANESAQPIAIFKHSTRCGISRMAQSALQRNWNLNHDEVHFYYLDLLEHRAISNEIASRTGIEHQSPQLIVFKGGQAVYNASHSAISLEALRAALS